MENLNEEFLDVFGNFELSQDEKVQRYLETFDMKSLERVKKKQLTHPQSQENLKCQVSSAKNLVPGT